MCFGGETSLPSEAFESNAREFRGGLARGGRHNLPMNDVYSIALGGIQTATKRFEASATRVAQDPHADLAAELVDQKLAEYAFKANVTVIKTANRMSKALLDILV